MNIIKTIIAKLHIKDVQARNLFKGSTLAFAFKIGGMLINYLFTYQVTKNYGAQITGLFNLGLVVLVVSTVISRLGLDTAMLRFTTDFWIKGRKDELKATYLEMLRVVVPVCLAANMILYFGADYLAVKIFSKPSLGIFIKVLSFTVLPYSLIMIHSECLRAIKYVNYYLFYEGIAINLFNAVLLFICFFWNQDETILIYTCLVSTIAVGIHSTCTWLKKSEILSEPETKGKSIREILKISLPMLTSNSLMNLTSWVDTIMLGIFRSAVDVGVYNISIKIALITKITLTAVNSISAPKFAAYYSLNDMQSFAKTAQYSTKLIFWTSAPIMILILFFPGFCLGIFGDEFKVGAMALVILTIGQFIASISGSVGYILNLTDSQVLQQNITMVAVAVNIVLNILLIPHYGIIGAATASATGLVLRNLISVYYIKRKFNFLTLYIPFLTTSIKK